MKRADVFSVLDQPSVHEVVFHPRPAYGSEEDDERNVLFDLKPNIRIGCRFYTAGQASPTILFFHGNGEIASDYDTIGPIYNQYGISFLVVDYRGYGKSGGKPSASCLLSDSHTIFREVRSWLESQGRTGLLIVMGRSLGSAPALEVASCYQDKLAGLILDSAFARTVPLLNRLGMATHTLGISEMDGFWNFGKIRDIGKPTLIIHGQKDEIIPPEDADILLANAGTMRKELMLAAGCGHNDILLRCGEAYFRAISRFAEMLKRLKRKAAKGRGFDRRYPRR